MKPTLRSRFHRGFTLLETVIAIGVLAVLLTGFMIVFAPAADGIRKSLNIQQADRLASTAELEIVTLRGATETTNYKTGFNKAYDWIGASNVATSTNAVLVYQYRGSTSSFRTDGTPNPVLSLTNMSPGKDYVVVPMMRRVGDPFFNNATTGDIAAIEGAIYLVKCTQLVYKTGQLSVGTAGTIVDPKTLAAVGRSPLNLAACVWNECPAMKK